ncbi:hypothetical protein D3C87_1843170 [compost metagenome]
MLHVPAFLFRMLGTGGIDPRVGFVLQLRGQPLHQILQRLADRGLAAGGTAVLGVEFPQVLVDGRLRAGITERDAHGVDRRVLALGDERVARRFHFGFVESGAGHRASSLYRNGLHTT